MNEDGSHYPVSFGTLTVFHSERAVTNKRGCKLLHEFMWTSQLVKNIAIKWYPMHDTQAIESPGWRKQHAPADFAPSQAPECALPGVQHRGKPARSRPHQSSSMANPLISLTTVDQPWLTRVWVDVIFMNEWKWLMNVDDNKSWFFMADNDSSAVKNWKDVAWRCLEGLGDFAAWDLGISTATMASCHAADVKRATTRAIIVWPPIDGTDPDYEIPCTDPDGLPQQLFRRSTH